jgi:hypothetical protein
LHRIPSPSAPTSRLHSEFAHPAPHPVPAPHPHLRQPLRRQLLGASIVIAHCLHRIPSPSAPTSRDPGSGPRMGPTCTASHLRQPLRLHRIPSPSAPASSPRCARPSTKSRTCTASHLRQPLRPAADEGTDPSCQCLHRIPSPSAPASLHAVPDLRQRVGPAPHPISVSPCVVAQVGVKVGASDPAPHPVSVSPCVADRRERSALVPLPAPHPVSVSPCVCSHRSPILSARYLLFCESLSCVRDWTTPFRAFSVPPQPPH